MDGEEQETPTEPNRGGRRPGEGWEPGRPRLPEGPVVRTVGAGLTQVEVEDLEALRAFWGLGKRGQKEAIRRAIRLARATLTPRAEEP